jgi:hypothetical protein
MSASRATVLVLAVLLASACGTASRAHAERAQSQFRCGLSVAAVEQIVGGRVQAQEVRDPRLTHLYRDGRTDLWLTFDNSGLRSSQLIQVVGLKGTEAATRLEHCKGS